MGDLPTEVEYWCSCASLIVLHYNHALDSTVPQGSATLPTSCHFMLCSFSLLYMWPRSLSCWWVGLWSAIKRWSRAFAQMRIARRVSRSQSQQVLFGAKLEDTEVVWYLTYPGARRRRGFSPELPRAKHDPTRDILQFLIFTDLFICYSSVTRRISLQSWTTCRKNEKESNEKRLLQESRWKTNRTQREIVDLQIQKSKYKNIQRFESQRINLNIKLQTN